MTLRAIRVPGAAQPWACHLGAVLLVALYVNTFGVWRLVRSGLGPEAAGLVPWAFAGAAVLGVGALWLRGPRRARDLNLLLLLAGVAAALAGLLLSDPAFPAKRIHVPQYILLALVVRPALGRHLGGAALVVATLLIATLYGVHDELAQGLHPARNFGLRDLGVNALGAGAGALLAPALGGGRADAWRRWPRRLGWLAALPAMAGLGLLLVALASFRDQRIPYWTVLPLLAGGLAWFAYDATTRAEGPWRPVLCTAVWLSVLAAIYPTLANEATLAFH